MKKLISLLLALVLLLSFAACGIQIPMLENKVLSSLGEYEKREYFTSGGFQDFTDYAKYYYAEVDMTKNAYFTKVQKSDISKIHTHLDDFENWLETIKKSNAGSEVVVNYDFDRSIIDKEDYIYIESEGHTWSDGHTSFTKYNVYFFDSQTQTLYYFHNNI